MARQLKSFRLASIDVVAAVVALNGQRRRALIMNERCDDRQNGAAGVSGYRGQASKNDLVRQRTGEL